jgi:hypothetical protein
MSFFKATNGRKKSLEKQVFFIRMYLYYMRGFVRPNKKALSEDRALISSSGLSF